MKYIIRQLDGFLVVGQEIEVTNSKSKNIEISTRFWQRFNANLKKCHLSQHGNWVKYAFMERKNGKLFYYCAIATSGILPEGFTLKEIKPQKYLVVEHIGSMDKIYDTYGMIYQKLLPKIKKVPLQTDFLHFERYDYRFHWNRENSVIEIWVPIEY